MSKQKNNVEPSNEVEVEIEISDENFLFIARLAHENDITFNKMCKKILSKYIEIQPNADIDINKK